MTQEEKELLLKDLTARLPYGVKFKVANEEYIKEIHYIKDEDVYIREYRNLSYWIDIIKPYLRPMSSMTEEERREYKHLVAFGGSPDGAANFVDWLNKKMFAYRTIDGKDMFELRLALEAPKEMY